MPTIENSINFSTDHLVTKTTRLERAEIELKAAKEEEKANKERAEKAEQESAENEKRTQLALKTLAEVAAGEITENAEARVQAAEAILNY